MTPARRRTAALLAAASAGLLLSGLLAARAQHRHPALRARRTGCRPSSATSSSATCSSCPRATAAPACWSGPWSTGARRTPRSQLEVSGTTAELDVPAGASVAIGAGGDRPDGEQSTVLSETVEIDQVEVAAGDAVELVVTAPASRQHRAARPGRPARRPLRGPGRGHRLRRRAVGGAVRGAERPLDRRGRRRAERRAVRGRRLQRRAQQRARRRLRRPDRQRDQRRPERPAQRRPVSPAGPVPAQVSNL